MGFWLNDDILFRGDSSDKLRSSLGVFCGVSRVVLLSRVFRSLPTVPSLPLPVVLGFESDLDGNKGSDLARTREFISISLRIGG